jgi:hypothetical protein
MKKYIQIILISSLIINSSCSGLEEGIKRKSTGAPGEIVVVMNGSYQKGAPGQAVRSLLKKTHVALPQDEPLFTVLFVKPGKYTKWFTTHRNILETKISPDEDEGKVLVADDPLAIPQLVIKVLAPTEEAFLEIMEQRGNDIAKRFLEEERKRHIRAFRKNMDEDLSRGLKEKHHVDVAIPSDYKKRVNNEGFAWYCRKINRHALNQCILVYEIPYTGPEDLKKENLIAIRDSILEANVEGSVDSSYMTTEWRRPLYYYQTEVDGHKAVEIRGLWRMINDYMGGPFISLNILDEKRGRIVVLEGFVYAPDHDKREYLRQQEAIIYSVKIPE